MRSRLFATAAVVLLAVPPITARAPAPAAKSGGPPVTFQLQPVDGLLKTVKAVVTAVVGDGFADTIDGQIKGKLGEKGFAGLDTTRPIAGYAYLPDKMPKEAEDFKGLTAVVAVPITDEAGFKDFLSRLSPPNDQLKLVPLKDAGGLYSVETDAGEPPFPIRLRFVGKTAFFGFNAADELMAADRLLRPETIIDPKETAVLAAKLVNDRLPKAWTENTGKQFEEQIEQIKQIAGNDPAAAGWIGVMTAYLKWTQNYSSRMTAEAKESGYRLRYDEATAEVGFEAYSTPKPGTALARQLADRKPPTHRFAGLLAKDAAASVVLQIPMMDDEFRGLLNAVIEQGEKKIEDAPPEARGLLKEVYAGLRRTVKTDGFDLATVVSGPDKKGHFAAVQCIAFEDAVPLEAAVKAAVRQSKDAKVKDAFKFDVDKAGAVNLHQLVIPEDAPDGFKRVFGTAEVYLAFGPKGIYAAIGDRAKEAVTAALAAKPGPARPFEIAANPKRLGELIAAADENAGGMAKQVLGTDDKLTPALYFDVAGGERMTFRFAMNVKLLVKPMVMATGVWAR